MTAFVHRIETLVPPYVYRQDYARDRMSEWLPGRKTRRLIRSIYDHSGIETRYSVLPDFAPGMEAVLFGKDASGDMREPTTEKRNLCYAQWARKLAVEVSRKALANAEGFRPEDVTHVITVSCTGFFNPGPDLLVVQELEMADSVERYQLGFMGCYAAFPALRMAQQFCAARPDAVVLVVCLEFCSLHLQVREAPDSLLANALFADGVAAAVVSARRPSPHTPAFALHTFSSALASEGAGDMAWSIGDQGFNIRLSAYVPKIIGAHVGEIVDRILDRSPWNRSDIGVWAVHPGGRAILDKLQQALDLAPEQIADSRAVLSAFGNMSSVTILFVLKRILSRSGNAGNQAICALAFGPGLAIESALLERVAAGGLGMPSKRLAHANPATV